MLVVVQQDEADYYMKHMVAASTSDTVTLDQWRSYFENVAYADTGIAATSPTAAKTLAALEYADALMTKRKADAKPRIKTTNFWPRVDKLFANLSGVDESSAKARQERVA
mgnify:CR=1 FL=1